MRTITNPRRLNPSALRKAKDLADEYRRSHWGAEAGKLYNVPGVPDCVQMGELYLLKVREKLRGGTPFDLDFESYDPKCHLAYTPDKARRLYIVLTEPAQRACARELWIPGAPAYLLEDVARMAPGRQSNVKRYPYPHVKGQVLGLCTHVDYQTEKIEDASSRGQGGDSIYRHQMGEDGGHPPYLVVSEDGRLWFAGGTYTVKPGGIER